MESLSKKRLWGPEPRYPMVEAYNKDHEFTIIAGPCSVESADQIFKIAKHAAGEGATHLRGGVFRAGTYYNPKFGWVEASLISAYSSAAKKYKLKNIIEVLDYRSLEWLDPFAECYQIGCRQMQNYTLLAEVAKAGKPVFLKRHPGSTIDEFLGAADQLLQNGALEVTLIERGSSTNARHVRWDLSISMIPAVKAITKMPILVDASHGTGRNDLVIPMTMAGIAAGADGLLVEFHENPECSLSDAEQALSFKQFDELMFRVKQLRRMLKALNAYSEFLT